MRKLDFYGLPRALQDRFIESSQGVSVPRPLLVQPEPDRTTRAWALLAVAFLGAWAVFTFLGFGDLESSLAIGGPAHWFGHIVLAGFTSYFALRAYARTWETSRIPYGSGAFLFPSGVIRALGSQLNFCDAAEVQRLDVRVASVAVVTRSRTFVFEAPSGEHAEAVRKAFEEGSAKWVGLSEKEALERARLSPLVESGIPNPLAPTDPHPRPRLMSSTVLAIVVAVLAAVLGSAVSYIRTSLSEAALYRAAVTKNTVESLNQYLARGGQRPEVQEIYLPRAELVKAKASGTVEAIEAFQKAHPGSKIAAESELALRDALLAELEKAKAQGSLSAIDAFRSRSPHTSLVATEIAYARRGVIQKALEKFKEQSNPENQAVLPFVQRLLAYSEQHGPRVLIRIRQEFPQQPESVDNVVMKSKKYYLGKKVLPSQYFLGDYARKREKALLEGVRERLQQAFPEDVLHFEVAPLPTASNEPLPESDVPTLTLQHQEKLSGGFVGGVPKTMFMGAAIYFKATFELPEGGDALEDKMTLWRPPRFAPFGAEREKDIPEVYEDIASGAFEIYQRHLLGAWFQSPSP